MRDGDEEWFAQLCKGILFARRRFTVRAVLGLLKCKEVDMRRGYGTTTAEDDTGNLCTRCDEDLVETTEHLLSCKGLDGEDESCAKRALKRVVGDLFFWKS